MHIEVPIGKPFLSLARLTLRSREESGTTTGERKGEMLEKWSKHLPRSPLRTAGGGEHPWDVAGWTGTRAHEPRQALACGGQSSPAHTLWGCAPSVWQQRGCPKRHKERKGRSGVSCVPELLLSTHPPLAARDRTKPIRPQGTEPSAITSPAFGFFLTIRGTQGRARPHKLSQGRGASQLLYPTSEAEAEGGRVDQSCRCEARTALPLHGLPLCLLRTGRWRRGACILKPGRRETWPSPAWRGGSLHLPAWRGCEAQSLGQTSVLMLL